VADTVGRAVRRTGDHHPAVAVADQDDVLQILEVHQFHDILDVTVEVHTAAEKMLAFAQSSQRWRENIVSVRAQQACDGLVAPAAVPTAMTKT
jgi:hypothetical protein